MFRSVIHDVNENREADAERHRLAAAIEQVAVTVMIADPDANIVYVNPAFERSTGYSRGEVLGVNPRILQSGQQTPAFYAAMWTTLTAGRTWHGEFVNRRKDGTLFTEEASITPVFTADGTLLHYVCVKRDVTAARALQARLGGSTEGRAAISAMVADLIPADSPEATARSICDRVLTVPGLVVASLALFLPRDRAQLLASVGLDRVDVPAIDARQAWPEPMRRRIRHLREQVQAGPSVESWSGAGPTPMNATFARLGVTALAVAPVRFDGLPIGFLQVGAAGDDAEGTLTKLLPTLDAFGIVASFLLRDQLDGPSRTEGQREAIRRIIDHKAFRPVFQPIVALPTGVVVGFEALTRFSDGTRPDQRFAAAAAVGVGVDLELVTLEAAIAAARTLPLDAWLDVNVSAAMLQDPGRLGHLLRQGGPRQIVIEITEHEVIDDYRRLRELLDELGFPVRLAVEEAGAGYTSLRHILELRPDMIKLDRLMVAAIDGDAARQGLVAGVCHFASMVGATVTAVGILTYAERATLLGLGVEVGQGYLLGKPGPAARVRSHVFKPVDRRTAVLESATGIASPVGLADPVHRMNAILWEADGTVERMKFVSGGAFHLTGHHAARWLAQPGFWDDHVHPDDRPATLDAIRGAMADGHAVSLEYRFRLADGTYRWFEDLVEVLPGQDGHIRLVGVMIDVTERRSLAEQLAHRATHDALTGLLNREGFEHVLAGALPVGDAKAAAVLFLDLDNFKIVNDSLGHRAGDELLRIIATRLRASVRGSDAVARFGGDEFLVLATAENAEALVQLGHRLVDSVTAPSEIDRRSMRHPVSAGIALVTSEDTPESAVRNADLAMYAAKQQGGNALVLYEPAMHEAAVNRLATHSR